MGMFDLLKVHPSLIPQKANHVEDSQYKASVTALLKGDAQLKDLSCTLDDYAIDQEWRLLVTSNKWTEWADRMLPEETAMMQAAVSCTDASGRPALWLTGYTGDLHPCGSDARDVIVFIIEKGVLVRTEWHIDWDKRWVH